MKELILLFLFGIFINCSWGGVIDSSSSSSTRNDKLLPFLAVVSFPNDECTVGMGATAAKGVCYSKKQCKAKGGVELAGGTCAQGYGVCCSFTISCPASGGSVTVKQNLTVITANTMPSSCNFVIPKQADVCQIRLDFIQFQLGKYEYGPVTDPPPEMNPTASALGSCTNDKLMISPTQNLPDGIVICGSATNQHLYLHYGDQEKITLSFTQMATQMQNYMIKVTMIKCNSVLKAPLGCTQYHRQKTARVESFNFPNMQLNSHRYSVCVDNSGGERKIQWRPCLPYPPLQSTSFFVSGMAPPVPGSNGPEHCVTDYVLLPGSDGERYCGGNFTSIAESPVIPFSLWVNFDEAEIPKGLIPSSYIDPKTGCPLGFTCSNTLPPKMNTDPCVPGDMTQFCFPPPGYADLQDNYNIGFCLEYVIGST